MKIRDFPRHLPFALLLAPVAGAQISFGPAVGVPAGPNPEWSALADLDGDGDRDVAVTADAPDRIVLLRNDGAGNLSAAGAVLTGTGSSPHALLARDVDGDGDMDLAVTLKGIDAFRVYQNLGGFAFAQLGGAAVGADPRSLTAGNFDGDGDVDFATSNRDGNTVTVVTNLGAGFSAVSIGVEGIRGIACGDLDGDGDLDLAVGSQDARSLDILTNAGGAFSVTGSLSLGPQLRPEGVVAGDLDNDGDTDLATAASGGGLNVVATFLKAGAGFTGPATAATGGLDPSQLAAGDLDVDGDLDLAVVNTDSGTVAVLANSGAGAFALSTTLAAGVAPQHVAAGDLDGNGNLELVATVEGTGGIAVFDNAGPVCGTFPYGVGLGGANVASLSSSSTAAIGTALVLDLAGFTGSGVAALAISGGQVQLGGFLGGTLLIDLGLVGFSSLVSVTGGSGALSIPLPPNPKLVGNSAFAQAAMLDGTAPAGWALTNGLRIVPCL